MTDIIGATPTPFAALADKCEQNDCYPVFRAETFNGTVRYSLSAMKSNETHPVYDMRLDKPFANAADGAGELVEQALGEWWA